MQVLIRIISLRIYMDSIRSYNSCTFFFFVNLCKCRLHYCVRVCLFLALVACLLPRLYVWVLILLSSLPLLFFIPPSHTYFSLSLSLHIHKSTELRAREHMHARRPYIGKLLQAETIRLYIISQQI